MDEILQRIEAMEAAPGEPEWISLDIFDIPWSEDLNVGEAIHNTYYEVEEAFEKIVEAVDARIGPNDPDLFDDIAPEILEGLKEPYFWAMPDEGRLVLGWVHESNEAPVEILAARVVE